MPTPTTPTWLSPSEGSTHDASVLLEWSPSTVSAGTAPTGVAITSPASGGSYTAGQALAMSGTATDATSVSIYRDGVLLGAATINGDTWSYSYAAPAEGSSVSLVARATNASGSTDSAAITLTFTAPPSNQAPSVTLVLPASGASVVAGTQLLLALTASDADGTIASARFNVNGGANVAATYNSGTSRWEATITAPAAGSHSFTGTATDDDGASTTSGARSFTTTAASSEIPKVTAFSDNFNDNALDTTNTYDVANNPVEVNGALDMSIPAGAASTKTAVPKTAIDLTGKRVTVKFAACSVANADDYMALILKPSSGSTISGGRVEIYSYGGEFAAWKTELGGSDYIGSAGTTPGAPFYVSIAHRTSDDMLLFQWSTTGADGSWTTLASISRATLEFTITSLYITLVTDRQSTPAGASTFIFDDLNV